MQILKDFFPNLLGFQGPICSLHSLGIQKGNELIQCVNFDGMYRITIATLGCTQGTVRIYDSLHNKLILSLKNTVQKYQQNQEQKDLNLKEDQEFWKIIQKKSHNYM